MAKPANKTAKQEEIFEVSVSDEAVALLTPAAILIGAIIVAASVIFSVGPVNETLKELAESGGINLNSDVQGESTETGENTNTTTYPTVESSSSNPFSYDESAEVCYVDGKPLVFLISTSSCPHCQWIKETFDNWARANSDKYTIYHYEYGYNDAGETTVFETISGQEVGSVPAEYETMYNNYSGGYVPTFVFGCKYFRIGNGFETNDGSPSEEAFANEIAEYERILGLLE